MADYKCLHPACEYFDQVIRQDIDPGRFPSCKACGRTLTPLPPPAPPPPAPAVTTYMAYFVGRTKGAIGIFYPIGPVKCEGATETAARLQLYDWYEHIQLLRLVPMVTRYVATYIPTTGDMAGVRTLMTAAQGRHTYATPEEAQHWIDAVTTPSTNSPEVLRSVWGDDPRYAVRPCACYPGHFDPIGIYFDSAE